MGGLEVYFPPGVLSICLGYGIAAFSISIGVAVDGPPGFPVFELGGLGGNAVERHIGSRPEFRDVEVRSQENSSDSTLQLGAVIIVSETESGYP